MSTSNKKYDAFISFRGEDTRDIFAIPLHDALENQNIDTYIDISLKEVKIERNRKVFIVLDNVDNIAQLKSLCGALNGLGANTNSRLVITTRDKRTLKGNVDEIHEVTKWSFQDSLKFFIGKAFEQGNPQQGYDSVLKEAVDYAGGVPLALELLSSHFYSKDLAFWKSQLNYLKNNGECFNKIQQVLKVSYNEWITKS
ncbi:hypothetical protein TSUD_357170 [Trifolium subterraneum]|uniref:Uncharacterized protein n=1 Tax=Trifolium subterraneum TaxID=3900 RepID=A0A2Z6MNM2_TRISU|nr:hypothetical protein TSUD_357170 [Trifolium subterraneum]